MGCGKVEDNRRVEAFYTNSDFTSTVSYFYTSAKERNVYPEYNLIIDYDENYFIGLNGVIGVCIITSNKPPVVKVKKSWYQTASTSRKMSLIFHELGHCLLKRPHKTSYVNVLCDKTQSATRGYYSSIMFPYLINDGLGTYNYNSAAYPTPLQFFNDNLEKYIDELFNSNLDYTLGEVYSSYSQDQEPIEIKNGETVVIYNLLENGNCSEIKK